MKKWSETIKSNLLNLERIIKVEKNSKLFNIHNCINFFLKETYNLNSYRNYQPYLFNQKHFYYRNNFNLKKEEFQKTIKFHKTNKIKNFSSKLLNISTDKNQSQMIKRVRKSHYENLIRKAMAGKYIKYKISKKEINLYFVCTAILNLRITKIIITLIILYLVILKIRLFRFLLPKLFYKFTSEPQSILYEFYFGSKLNVYIKRIVNEVINDEEVQEEAKKYLLELLEDEKFINSIAEFTNHLLVMILKEETLIETFFDKILSLFNSERLEIESKKFLIETANSPVIKNWVIDLLGYFLMRPESDDAIKQFIERGFIETVYDPDFSVNLNNLVLDFITSNYLRKKYVDKVYDNYMNDYPDEKSLERVLEIIKDDKYIIPHIFKKKKKNATDNTNDKEILIENTLEYMEKVKKKIIITNKEKFKEIYKYNNFYIDGYFSKKNPNSVRDKILELGKIYKNIIYSDSGVDPDYGLFCNYGSYIDKELTQLIVDKKIFKNKALLEINKNEKVYLNKFIKENNLENEYQKMINFEEVYNKPKMNLEDMKVNFDTNFYNLLEFEKIGHYFYKDAFFYKSNLTDPNNYEYIPFQETIKRSRFNYDLKNSFRPIKMNKSRYPKFNES